MKPLCSHSTHAIGRVCNENNFWKRVLVFVGDRKIFRDKNGFCELKLNLKRMVSVKPLILLKRGIAGENLICDLLGASIVIIFYFLFYNAVVSRGKILRGWNFG